MAARRYVVDASVVAKWFFNEALSAEADGLADSEAVLLAPDLLLAELAHVVRKRVLRREIDAALAESILPGAASRLEIHPLADHLNAAFRLSLHTRIAVYDAIYVALAAAARIPLITADDSLLRALRAHRLGRLAKSISDREFAPGDAI